MMMAPATVPKPLLEFHYLHSDEVQVGVDEAGKGCMIGPVFAGAVIWDPSVAPTDIKDSKKLSRKKRAVVRRYIEDNALAYGVGSASCAEVDAINISQATYLAMHRALDALKEREQERGRCAADDAAFDRILVDGNLFKPYCCMPHTCVVGGDNKYVCIAAASILAKENHDDWITEHFGDDTKYDLMNNKGYGTKAHMKGLSEHGLCEHHRRTYCKKFI